jgi:hypothetical protein
MMINSMIYFLQFCSIGAFSNEFEVEHSDNASAILSYDYENIADLRRFLLANYDRKSRPLFDSSQPITVYVDADIEQISNLDEVYQVSTKYVYWYRQAINNNF